MKIDAWKKLKCYEFGIFLEFLFLRFLRPLGDGVPLAEESPGVFRLYESRILKNNESPFVEGFEFSAFIIGDLTGDMIGDTFTEDGQVDISFFVSSTTSRSDETRCLTKDSIATAANPPAAAKAICGNFKVSFIPKKKPENQERFMETIELFSLKHYAIFFLSGN